MHRPLRFLAAGLIAALATPALATNGMRMTGFGAVQNGMGGVGVGATLDANAIASNPAGLSELERRLDGSLTLFMPSVEYWAEPQPYVNEPGVVFESNKGLSIIPNVAATYPLSKSFTAGLGLFGVAGMGVDYDANLFGSPTLTNYQQLKLAPAISFKADDVISFGLALNFAFGQMEYDVASAFGQVPHDTASAFGFGYTVGVKLNPSKTVSIGLAYESKTDFQDFEFDIGPHTAMTPMGPMAVPGGTDVLAFDQPPVISAGIAWQVIPPLLLAFDVSSIGWNQTMGAGQPGYTNDTNLTGAMPFDMSWSEQLVYKLGAQYQAMPGLKVRAGYNYGQNPLQSDRAFENIAFPAIAEHHISLGAGWMATETLEVNLAGTYSPQKTVSGSNEAQGLSAYATSMSQLAFDLAVAWKF